MGIIQRRSNTYDNNHTYTKGMRNVLLYDTTIYRRILRVKHVETYSYLYTTSCTKIWGAQLLVNSVK